MDGPGTEGRFEIFVENARHADTTPGEVVPGS
jgi:hypothetical protein